MLCDSASWIIDYPTAKITKVLSDGQVFKNVISGFDQLSTGYLLLEIKSDLPSGIIQLQTMLEILSGLESQFQTITTISKKTAAQTVAMDDLRQGIKSRLDEYNAQQDKEVQPLVDDVEACLADVRQTYKYKELAAAKLLVGSSKSSVVVQKLDGLLDTLRSRFMYNEFVVNLVLDEQVREEYLNNKSPYALLGLVSAELHPDLHKPVFDLFTQAACKDVKENSMKKFETPKMQVGFRHVLSEITISTATCSTKRPGDDSSPPMAPKRLKFDTVHLLI